jgi:hypothetical protein
MDDRASEARSNKTCASTSNIPVRASTSKAPTVTTATSLQSASAELTAVIGREREIDAISALLRRPSVRLLTLSGPAGIGKTRLSLEVANRVQGDFQDRVCFVPLAPVSEARLVVSAIASALGVREVPQQPFLTTLQEFLHTKALLLVLDNFEQVVDAAPVVRTLLMASPQVKALVTSREILHLYGEQEFAVPALDVPDARHIDNVDAVAHSTAVELFVERARANRLDFDLTPDNARAVAEICICLDGSASSDRDGGITDQMVYSAGIAGTTQPTTGSVDRRAHAT